MKSEVELRQAILLLDQQDKKCPTTACREGRGVCMDVGHAIRGTWRAALRWALDERKAPW